MFPNFRKVDVVFSLMGRNAQDLIVRPAQPKREFLYILYLVFCANYIFLLDMIYIRAAMTIYVVGHFSTLFTKAKRAYIGFIWVYMLDFICPK